MMATDMSTSMSCSSQFVSLGLCQLNQWALDFEGNLERILESICRVKDAGAFYRIGPELEITGYSCDDHFFESDTTQHAWQSIVKIIQSGVSHNCLLDIGMPVEHRSVRYNCRVFILNDKIILIRPKCTLANDGHYRESRWFGAFSIDSPMEELVLPKSVQKVTGQERVPFGFAAVECNDCSLASESCEELFAPNSPHLKMCLDGVDIFANASGSYYELGKLAKRTQLILAPMAKMGGIYMYCNDKGMDGGRLYFDGASFVSCNGEILSMISPFQLDEIETIVVKPNITKVRSFRASLPSFNAQGSFRHALVPRVRANIWLSGTEDSSLAMMKGIPTADPCALTPLDLEIGLSPACWLWDYLRRSGAGGFLVPLSGGADSAAVATIVYLMCVVVMRHVEGKNAPVIAELEKVTRLKSTDPNFPKSAGDLCFLVLHTVYMGTSHSSEETRCRAKQLAQQIHSYHCDANIDPLFEGSRNILQQSMHMTLSFANSKTPATPISKTQDLVLQNLQARSRMLLAYGFATSLPLSRAGNRMASPDEIGAPLGDVKGPLPGFLLVLSTGNLDETLRGYYTKYDCSSGDLNPIGSLRKEHIKKFLAYCAVHFGLDSLSAVLKAAPTAELRPTETDGSESIIQQTDEVDMGITYEQLGLLGKLRKQGRSGPVEMFETLVQMWREANKSLLAFDSSTPHASLGHTGMDLSLSIFDASSTPVVSTQTASRQTRYDFLSNPETNPESLAKMVKHFFVTYGINRHKTSTLTPGFHADASNADENRFDWRPMVYPNFNRQFAQIDMLVAINKK